MQPRTVSQHVSDPRHAAAALDGATNVGEAAGAQRLLVRLGVWRLGGQVARARYRASTCASLIAYAEVACALLEAGAPPSEIDSARLRAEVPGVHPVHHDRADLVAAAVRATFDPHQRSAA
jgi:NifU-like protein involved in Fe-S cluster formation